jgi:hypothetical protein
MLIEEYESFIVARYWRARQFPQCIQHLGAVMQMAARKFSDNERVTQHEAGFEHSHQRCLAAPQMLYPDRRIYQDHDDARRFGRTGVLRRRGGTVAPGLLPPRRARRRAASRSISACRASRNTAERSVVPAAALAALSSFSSSVTVVRMMFLQKMGYITIHYILHQMMLFLM